jgi:hypothetical protein
VEAYELFVKLQCRSAESFFTKASDVYYVLIQLEECEENDEEINCIDVKNEWWITNPNFKEKNNMNIKQIAYEKYKLDWLLKHGHTLMDLMEQLDEMQEESDESVSVSQLFIDWEYGFGFGSEIWACYQEFIDNEYQDAGYMKQLLTWEEYEKYQEEI